jgi:hypothetical protein
MLSHYTPRGRLVGEDVQLLLILDLGIRWGCVVSRPGRVSAPGKDPQYTLYRRLGGPQSRSAHRGYRKNPFASAGDLDRPVVQPVARHYTDWATRLTI